MRDKNDLIARLIWDNATMMQKLDQIADIVDFDNEISERRKLISISNLLSDGVPTFPLE